MSSGGSKVGGASGRKREGEGTSSSADDASNSTFASLNDDSRRLQCEPVTVLIKLFLYMIIPFYHPPLLLLLPSSLLPFPSSPSSPPPLLSTAMLEAQGLPPHLLGALGSKMQYILQKSFSSLSSSNCMYIYTCACRKCTIHMYFSLFPTQHLVLSNC